MGKITNAEKAEMVRMVKHFQKCDYAQFRCMETGEPSPYVEFVFQDNWYIQVSEDNENIAYAYRRNPESGNVKYGWYLKLKLN